MSNNKRNSEQGQLIEQSEQQCSPALALPEDFEVQKYTPTPTPYHGQHGLSKSEESRLLNERFQGRPQQPTPERNIAGRE